jgi:muramidase (phage lysozyme)
MPNALLFSGICWPAAKVVARKQVVITSFRPSFPDFFDPAGNDKTVRFEDTLVVETTGQGRPYSIMHAEAWWRDFAELPLDDEKRVLSFLQRRGDPLSVLAPGGQQISTADWHELKATLQCAAMAWDPQLDEAGMSRFRPEMLESTAHMFAFSHGWVSELEVAYRLDPRTEWPPGARVSRDRITGPVTLRAKILAAYLCCAAVASVHAGKPMRRCDYCHSWFTLHRSDARQCSASCRAASSNQRKSPHAFGS